MASRAPGEEGGGYGLMFRAVQVPEPPPRQAAANMCFVTMPSTPLGKAFPPHED